MSEERLAYKGFSEELTCQGDYQYEEGKEYECKHGVIEVCNYGFHACGNPFDVLFHYHPYHARYGLVSQSGTMSFMDDHSKQASSRIKIKKIYSLKQYIRLLWKYAKSEIDTSYKHEKSGLIRHFVGLCYADDDGLVARSDSWRSVSLARGSRSVALTTEHNSVAVASTARSIAWSAAKKSVAIVSAAYSRSVAEGERSIALAMDFSSRSEAVSYGSIASTFGVESRAIAYDKLSLAACAGRSALSVTYSGNSVAVGLDIFTTAVSRGENSLAVAAASEGTAICEGERSFAVSLVDNAFIYVGKNSTALSYVTKGKSSETIFTVDEGGQVILIVMDDETKQRVNTIVYNDLDDRYSYHYNGKELINTDKESKPDIPQHHKEYLV
jgi:hypothetical protein